MSQDKDAPEWTKLPPLVHYTDQYRLPNRPTPTLPYEYWCKSSGNVVRLVIKTTRDLKNAQDTNRYTDYARRKARLYGWFPWKYQDALALHPIFVTQSGASNEDEWNSWREEERLRRKAAHERKAEQYNRAWQTQDDREVLKTQEGMARGLAKFMDAVKATQETQDPDAPPQPATPAAQPSRRRKRRDDSGDGE